jgi:predicted transcriptional regulator
MANWTFLTHHGHVLVALVQNPDQTIDELAQQVGITSRAVSGILNDLVEAGFVEKKKVGRNNVYLIHADAPMRHPVNEMVRVSELLALFSKP